MPAPASAFYPTQALSGLVMPTHNGEGIFFTQFADPNANLFRTHATETPPNGVLSAIWTSLYPVQLTHEGDHQNEPKTDSCSRSLSSWRVGFLLFVSVTLALKEAQTKFLNMFIELMNGEE